MWVTDCSHFVWTLLFVQIAIILHECCYVWQIAFFWHECCYIWQVEIILFEWCFVWQIAIILLECCYVWQIAIFHACFFVWQIANILIECCLVWQIVIILHECCFCDRLRDWCYLWQISIILLECCFFVWQIANSLHKCFYVWQIAIILHDCCYVWQIVIILLECCYVWLIALILHDCCYVWPCVEKDMCLHWYSIVTYYNQILCEEWYINSESLNLYLDIFANQKCLAWTYSPQTKLLRADCLPIFELRFHSINKPELIRNNNKFNEWLHIFHHNYTSNLYLLVCLFWCLNGI